MVGATLTHVTRLGKTALGRRLRITTEYIDTEDRIRLSGQCADGAAVVVQTASVEVIWLTRHPCCMALDAIA